MPDPHDHSPKPTRQARPPFIGPPRAGALAPKTRVDRPTLPPFSPPFLKRPSPTVPVPAAGQDRTTPPAESAAPVVPVERSAPSWLDSTPNESPPTAARVGEEAIEWVNPDAPAVVPPPQVPTGIEWLDSPTPERRSSPASAPAPVEEDDPFGWDPAEERGGAFDAAPVPATLEGLKEIEPWALPGGEVAGATSDDVAAALERVAARIRSGDLFVPATPATTDEAALASVLAALLQRARG